MTFEPKCKTCQHPDRREIDMALASGESFAVVARHYKVSQDSVKRHRRKHLPRDKAMALRLKYSKAIAERQAVREAVAQRVEEEEATRDAPDGVALLGKGHHLHRETLRVYRDTDDPKVKLQAIREAVSIVRLMGEMLGELNGGGTTVNIVNAPEWLHLQTVIIEALDAHPDARRAVIAAIEEQQQ
jgi:hypothetical protein